MAQSCEPHDGRRCEVWRRLAGVHDPELDEPVTELGFVERAEVEPDGKVLVEFRLPTYWCSPNFAFLMLDGLRQALESLSWRPVFQVRILDHMFADEVNRGIAEGRPFGEIFGDLAGDRDLDGLRETFRMKAFKRRQEAVLAGLRRTGMADADVLALDMGSLVAVGAAQPALARAIARYADAMVGRWPRQPAGAPAFLTWEGGRIAREELADYLAELRRVRINMEFNGALCRGLKRSRYKEMEMVEGEPTLVDFILDRVPPRGGDHAATT